MSPRAEDGGRPDLDLESELDRLYAMAPGGFVAARDDLAGRLRRAGRRDDAAAVKRLRRPTVAAWALNQLSRRRGDDVRRLVQHGEELRRLQDELLAGGDRRSLGDASRARRAAVDDLADTALELLSEEATSAAEGHRTEVIATLEAASLEPDAGAALLAGRLGTGLAPSPGLGLLPGPTPEAAPAQPHARRDESQGDGGDDAARQARLAEAREVAADADALAARRRAEAAALAEDAAAARRMAEGAEEEVERLARELDRARRSAAEGAEAARQTASRAADAERVAAVAEAQAAAANEALARLARLEAR